MAGSGEKEVNLERWMWFLQLSISRVGGWKPAQKSPFHPLPFYLSLIHLFTIVSQSMFTPQLFLECSTPLLSRISRSLLTIRGRIPLHAWRDDKWKPTASGTHTAFPILSPFTVWQHMYLISHEAVFHSWPTPEKKQHYYRILGICICFCGIETDEGTTTGSV